ncbi:hypothetical protein AB431_26060 [Mycobacterium sp. EPa45]|nr:hypothetical protein AB431_26060 [Mycobacterium sp. EPa45]
MITSAGDALAVGTRNAVIVAVVVAAVGVVDASVTAWVLEVVVVCWLSVVCAEAEESASAVAEDVADDVVSETDRLDCALGLSAALSVAAAPGVLA